jgi:hypothetical protein
VLLHTPQEGEPEPPRALSAEAMALRVPLPRPGYQWHLPAHFDSPEGFAFEHRIAAALRDAIQGWLG